MANKQKDEREQFYLDNYGTTDAPETANLDTEDLLRQINSLRKDLKKAGGKEKQEEYFTEADGTKNFHKKPDGKWKLGFHPNTEKTKWKSGTQPMGGRPKGSKNKKTLRQEAIDAGKFTPAEFLLSIVNDEKANMNQRISAAKEAAKYYDPSLSSVEVHTDEEHDAPFNVFLGTMPDKDNKDKEED